MLPLSIILCHNRSYSRSSPTHRVHKITRLFNIADIMMAVTSRTFYGLSSGIRGMLVWSWG